MIPEPLLRKYIDSDRYRKDLASRLNYPLSHSEMIVFIATVRRLAINRISSIAVSKGTSRMEAIIAYLRGIEPIAASEFALHVQINSLMFGSSSERIETLSSIQFPKPRKSGEAFTSWSKDEFEGFILECTAIDTETANLLHDARKAIDELRMARDDAQYTIGELNRLANQLATSKESEEIKTTWARIQETAPTIASILSAIASIAKILA